MRNYVTCVAFWLLVLVDANFRERLACLFIYLFIYLIKMNFLRGPMQCEALLKIDHSLDENYK